MKLFGNLRELVSLVFRRDGKEVTVTPADQAGTGPIDLTIPDVVDNADTFVMNDTAATLTLKTLTSPVLNGIITGDAFLDEDNMASDSSTKLASQQSIKAYVDAQVDTADEFIEMTDTPSDYLASKNKVVQVNDLNGTDGDQIIFGGEIGGSASGDIVDTDSTQTLSSKTLDNTTTLDVADSLLTLQDNVDGSKRFQFEASSITTATTRTYTMPDESDTLATENHVTGEISTHNAANTHVDHSTVSINGSGGEGISTGGDLTANRTLDLDIPGLTEDVAPSSANDFLVTYDASGTAHKKVLITNLPAGVASTAGQLLSTDATAGAGAGDLTVSAGKTLYHPYLTISTGDTYTITGRAVIGQELVVDGTYVVTGTSIIHNIES